MPSWKKIISSGSNASLNSLFVSNAITASVFSGSFTGSLFGTASNADTASYVNLLAGPNITINYQPNGIAITGSGGSGTPGGPNTSIQFNDSSNFSGSSNFTFDKATNQVQLTGSLLVSNSITASVFSGSFTGSLFGTASWAVNAITSSYPISISGSTIYSTAPLAGGSSFSTINSIFLGSGAGDNATNAYWSNFLGISAGLDATNAQYSNFLGDRAGRDATNAEFSNFIGPLAGREATNANNSNFLGYLAGFNAADAYHSNFLGQEAGASSTKARFSNFLGNRAGYQAPNALASNFLGYEAGDSATNANNSNFLGNSAGRDAAEANNSNFLGSRAGASATEANNSNFLGQSAGLGATNAQFSNFLGLSAGLQATEANNSNFLGNNAGLEATNANNSNFLGCGAGDNATDANDSNFLGYTAGANAYNATNANFLGRGAGLNAVSASYSTLIGYSVGSNGSGNSIGTNNIIIGKGITLANNREDSINLGGLIFGTGSYNGGTGFSGSAGGKIGINTPNPDYNFQASGTVAFPNLTSTTQTNVVTYDSATGQLFYTASSALGGGGGGATFVSTTNVDNRLITATGATPEELNGEANLTFNGSLLNLVGNQLITGSLTVSGSSTFTNIGPAVFSGSVSFTQGGLTGSLFGTASYATTSATSSYINGMILKNNAVSAGTFAGNPRKATVTFSTAFPNTNYSVTVTGEDARSWTIESKAAGSFIINTNSNTSLTNNVYWQAISYGEFNS